MPSARLAAQRPATALAVLVCGLGLAACSNTAPGAGAVATLDGQPPLVVAHRGASGYLPEETLETYARAIELSTDPAVRQFLWSRMAGQA